MLTNREHPEPARVYYWYKSIIGLTMGLYLYTYLSNVDKLLVNGRHPTLFGYALFQPEHIVIAVIAWLTAWIAVLEIVCGLFADRIGRRTALLLALAARGGCFALLAISAQIASSTPANATGAFDWMLASMFCLACFVALDSGTLSAWLNHELTASKNEDAYARIATRGRLLSLWSFFAGSVLACTTSLIRHDLVILHYACATAVCLAGIALFARTMSLGGRCEAPYKDLLGEAAREVAGNKLLWLLSLFYASVYMVFYLVDGQWMSFARSTSNAFTSQTGLKPEWYIVVLVAVFTLVSTGSTWIVESILAKQRWAHLGRSVHSLAGVLAIIAAVFAVPLLAIPVLQGTSLSVVASLLLLLAHKVGDGPLEPMYDSLQNGLVKSERARATVISLISTLKSGAIALVAFLALAGAHTVAAHDANSSALEPSDAIAWTWTVSASVVVLFAIALRVATRGTNKSSLAGVK